MDNRAGETVVFVRVVEAGSFSEAARLPLMTPSTDFEEVRRIYHWLIDTTRSLDGAFRVILTDQARFPEDPVFVSHVVHGWWEVDGALIPADWYSGEE